MRYFEFVHNLGLHAWDIPALVALVILVIMIIVHHNNQKSVIMILRKSWQIRFRRFEENRTQEMIRPQEYRREIYGIFI